MDDDSGCFFGWIVGMQAPSGNIFRDGGDSQFLDDDNLLISPKTKVLI